MPAPEPPSEPEVTQEPEPAPAFQVEVKPAPFHEAEKPPEYPPEPKPVPKSQAKPEKREASVSPEIEAEVPKSAKKRLIWVWILIALIAITGIFILGQTRGWFAQETFAGAIGNWKSQDSVDSSHQTLTIRRTIQGEYRLDYYDDFATVCGGGAARGTMSGKTSTATLNTNMTIQCELSYSESDKIWVCFKYLEFLQTPLRLDFDTAKSIATLRQAQDTAQSAAMLNNEKKYPAAVE